MKLTSFNLTAAKRTAMAVADRGLLGAVTFLTSIVLGRSGGPGELGLFALFFSLVFFALSLQESLIIAPFSIYAASRADGEERRRYLGGVFADSCKLGAIVAALFAAGAAGLWMIQWSQAASISLILAVAAPCILLREFARRIVYTDFRPDLALVISGVVSALQLAFLGALFASGKLTAATSFGAMGLSSLIGGAGWLVANRRSIEFAPDSNRLWRLEHWLIGRWLLAAQASEIARINMLPWLLALVTDETTVGIYAACAFVASLPTPLHVAISNTLLPEMAHLERRSGFSATDRLVRQATGWLTAIMVAYVAAILVVSPRLVPWIYGDKFSNTQHTLIVLAITWAITGATLPMARGLLVIKGADKGFWSQLIGIAANLVLGIPMVMRWGAPGAAYAALIGSILKGGLGCYWYISGARKLLVAEGVAAAPSSEPIEALDCEWSNEDAGELVAGETR